jgi:ferritin-like metal-binding protein YciE
MLDGSAVCRKVRCRKHRLQRTCPRSAARGTADDVAEPLDPGLVAAAQAIEHYEISRYGTLKTWAQELGLNEAVRLLDQTLEEERKTDAALTRIAETAVNQQAEAA